ncbi:acyl-CoA dehydrogenase family protein [Cohnella sp. CFH 77786]|uniref:acyl-CoA dehydrogenase family protein n=1 Tax=Cohnella sp. CFH 77786 TaxID=2662265 RepID=UPI00351CBE5F
MAADVYGGSFMIREAAWEDTAAPEDFAEEQLKLARMVRNFRMEEVMPSYDRLDRPDYGLVLGLLRKMGDLGLLAAEVSEKDGGLGLGQTTGALIAETLAPSASFALSALAHTGIGMLPVAYFGTPAQKAAWLPELMAGRRAAAYCLTEPEAGSDALGVKTAAVRSADGAGYLLNGTKQYISNAGFADLFVVYAKVDGLSFSAFVLDRDTPGFTVGTEERMMGLRGMSTCSLKLENAEVPSDRLLGPPGQGSRIAFGILNVGRFKLAAACVGMMKEATRLAAAHASARKQFGKPIASFPLISAKLAEMNTLAYVAESMVYRTAGDLEGALERIGGDEGSSPAEALAEFAIECSINKVFASEALDVIVDHGVQIHGGSGYAEGSPIERMYRDSRVNRIFEGTNEINRLRIPTMLLRRALKGEIPLLARAEEAQEELLKPLPPNRTSSDPLAREAGIAAALKKVFLLAGGHALQKYGLRLEREQELVAVLADLMIDAYALESAVLRSRKIRGRIGAAASSQAERMTALYAEDALERAGRRTRMLLAAIDRGESLRMQLAILKRLLRFEPADSVGLRRSVAAAVVAAGGYAL